jgi:uncharacterized protein (UPF0371 family)
LVRQALNANLARQDSYYQVQNVGQVALKGHTPYQLLKFALLAILNVQYAVQEHKQIVQNAHQEITSRVFQCVIQFVQVALTETALQRSVKFVMASAQSAQAQQPMNAQIVKMASFFLAPHVDLHVT